MTALTNADKRDEILKLAQGALERYQPRDYRVEATDVLEDGDWFYVVVQPNKEGIRNYDYFDILARAEEEIQTNQQRNVLLVPTVPG